MVPEILRAIPPVNDFLQDPEVEALLQTHPRHLVVETIQSELDQLRRQIQEGLVDQPELDRLLPGLAGRAAHCLEHRLQPSLKTLINATGVLIHTNAGRAPLSAQTAQAIAKINQGYSNLEYDLSRRRRGHRDVHFEPRVVHLLGCEAATVCNNNAAALFLILNTLAKGKEVLVSRGELVEIGGSFRIPDILESSGAVLREVGATNRTHRDDYRKALGEETAMILKVHSSNFRIVGFTAEAGTSELAKLAHKSGIPLVEDVGSGLLFQSRHPALRREPSVQRTLQQGADLVCFSGDKLLGGPQAGLIVGKRDWISRIRKNPLMRAVRVDKSTYAGLDHVLMEYEKETYRESIPIHQMLGISRETLRRRLLVLSENLAGTGLQAQVVEGSSLTGGGSAPEEHIPTWLLAVRHPGLSASQLEESLRQQDPPILVRIEEERVLIDLRTVFPEQDRLVEAALRRIVSTA